MPDLKAIVQRMIDAGESEENIATVIQHSKAPDAAPKMTAPQPMGEMDEHGNRIVRNPDGSVKFMQGPGFRGDLRNRPDSNMATIGGVGIAPEDVLMAPSLVKGAAAMGRGVGRAASVVRGPVASALDLGSAVLDNPIVGTVSPRAGQAGRLLGAAADFVRPKAVAAVADKAAPIAEAVSEAAPKVVAFNPNDTLKVARDAFKAAGIEPLKAEVSNVFELIRRGKTPEDALSIIVKSRPGGAPMAAYETAIDKAKTAVAGAETVPKLTAEEMKLGMDLMSRGKSPQEALDAVLAQKAFAKLAGVQSNATVGTRVAERNATGRWP